MKEGPVSRVRCFVCLEPDPVVRRNLQDWLESLMEEAPRLKWVRPSALHLTLKFCGEITPEQVEELAAGLRTEVAGSGSFNLGLEETGLFPARGVPRVLWGGLTGEMDALERLFRKVERVSVRCGISREGRPFSPHLTLARIRSGADFPRAWLPSGPPGRAAWGSWTVREVTLMESDLRSGGPVYSPIEKFPLFESQRGGR